MRTWRFPLWDSEKRRLAGEPEQYHGPDEQQSPAHRGGLLSFLPSGCLPSQSTLSDKGVAAASLRRACVSIDATNGPCVSTSGHALDAGTRPVRSTRKSPHGQCGSFAAHDADAAAPLLIVEKGVDTLHRGGGAPEHKEHRHQEKQDGSEQDLRKQAGAGLARSAVCQMENAAARLRQRNRQLGSAWHGYREWARRTQPKK